MYISCICICIAHETLLFQQRLLHVLPDADAFAILAALLGEVVSGAEGRMFRLAQRVVILLVARFSLQVP